MESRQHIKDRVELKEKREYQYLNRIKRSLEKELILGREGPN